jgi:hypothetical protein
VRFTARRAERTESRRSRPWSPSHKERKEIQRLQDIAGEEMTGGGEENDTIKVNTLPAGEVEVKMTRERGGRSVSRRSRRTEFVSVQDVVDSDCHVNVPLGLQGCRLPARCWYEPREGYNTE